MTNNIITSKQAAELLGIKLRTLRKWVQLRKIPYIRYSQRNVKFRAADLIEWQENKVVEPKEFKETKTIRQQRKSERLHRTAVDLEADRILAKHYPNKKSPK
jgi:excisionase family DNA binding protein